MGSKLASDSTPERKIKYFIDYGTYTFGVPFLFPVVQKWTAFFIPKIERRKKNMNKLVKRLLTGTLAFATILTALPVTAVHASGNQYWTESAERVGYIEHVMNDGSIKSTFNGLYALYRLFEK